MKMARNHSMLAIACLVFLVTTTMNQSLAAAARSLGSSTPTHSHNHQKMITFLMRDVLLNVTHPSSSKSKRATTKVTSTQLPFPKPIGLFPPSGGVPLTETNPTSAVPGLSSTQTLDLSGIGLFFPARATLQELEFGVVTLIEEDMFESTQGYGLHIIGKAQGIYVASSEDGSSHMMAMTAHFANSEFKDGLRFFGVHRTDMHDGSHIAVIGGIGKYVNANGYATVKALNAGPNSTGEGANKLLVLNVYLS